MEKCSSRTTGGGEGGKGWGEENKKSRAEGVSHLHATERSDAEPTAGGAPGGSDTAGWPLAPNRSQHRGSCSTHSPTALQQRNIAPPLPHPAMGLAILTPSHGN